MGKGIWEQAFDGENPETGSPVDVPGVLNGKTAAEERPTANKGLLPMMEQRDSAGTWEGAFYNRNPAAGRQTAPPANDRPRSGPAAPEPPSAPEAYPPGGERPLSSQPFHTAPVYRKRSTAESPVLAQLGDYLDKIWINIHLEGVDRPAKTFLFCGATRDVGATFISFHLALSLALERNMKVLYVDANMDNPDKKSMIKNMHRYPGLAAFLAGYRTLESLVLATQYRNLSILPSGACEIMRQPQVSHYKPRTIQEFVTYCKVHYDAAIFDAEPAVEYPSTTAFAREVDRTVIVCRYGHSRREVCRLAIDKMKENGIFIAGVVLNEREYPLPASVYATVK